MKPHFSFLRILILCLGLLLPAACSLHADGAGESEGYITDTEREDYYKNLAEQRALEDVERDQRAKEPQCINNGKTMVWEEPSVTSSCRHDFRCAIAGTLTYECILDDGDHEEPSMATVSGSGYKTGETPEEACAEAEAQARAEAQRYAEDSCLISTDVDPLRWDVLDDDKDLYDHYYCMAVAVSAGRCE